MTRRGIIGHFTPHIHEDGQAHRAHAIGISALFIYFQLFLVLVASLYLIRSMAPHILGTANFTAEQIITLTNAKRAENGLPALVANNSLATAAAAKSADMFVNDYWAHNSPNGKTPWSFIASAGYRYVFAGENLARDFADAASVVNAWMNSPSHRNNLLDGNFKEIGVAVENGKLGGREGSLVVQMFGASISQIPEEKPLAKVESTSSPSSQLSVDRGQKEAAVNREPIAVNPSAQATVLATRQFAIAKAASFFLVVFIFVLFAIEAMIATRREDMELRAGVFAHLGLLGFVMLAVWYAVQGAIL